MQTVASGESFAETDFYLEASAHYPLLSAEQERRIDLRKWASARRALRQLLSAPGGRALVEEFCRACLEQAPAVENFEPRSLFFTLRKDIVEFLPGGKNREPMSELLQQLRAGQSSVTVLRTVGRSHWPATLIVGLATLYLRRSGLALADPIADALEQWRRPWRLRFRETARLHTRRISRAINAYVAARDKLVMHNLRLVHKLAWDHPVTGIPQRDLVQDGIVGLIRAAEKYEFRRGFRFTTYAYPWINQHLQRATEGRGSLIGYPSHVVQEINKLHRARVAHQERTGHDPGIDTLSRLTGFQVDKVNKLRRLNNITVSIDHPEADDNELRLAAQLADPDAECGERAVEARSLKRLLLQHLDSLEERERAVLNGRWGLDGQPRRTFAQLADQLHVSREWVRQLEKSALDKLSGELDLNQAYEEMHA